MTTTSAGVRLRQGIRADHVFPKLTAAQIARVGSQGHARVAETGQVIELNREQLLALVQTDPELSEILMRAFILRRVDLIAGGLGDVVLIGSRVVPPTFLNGWHARSRPP